MSIYAYINISSSLIENLIEWDGVEYFDSGSDYILVQVSESIELTSSYAETVDIPKLHGGVFFGYVTGSITGSLTGSFNDYSGSLGWLDDFVSSSRTGSFTGSFTGSLNGSATGSFTGSYTGSHSGSGTGSYTGSFTGSLLGTVSNSSTASYVSNIKSGKVTSGEWVVELVGNNYTASVLLSSSYLNNSYAVSLTCGADVRTLSVTNKTPSGFNINSNSTSAMTDDVYWVTVPYNNP